MKKYKRNQAKRLIIRADLPPDPTSDEQLKLYKKAGFNSYTMTEDFVRTQSKAYFDCINKCGESGLDVLVRGYSAQVPTYFDDNFFGVNFCDYPSVKGFFVTDEPSDEQLTEVARVYVPWFNEYYADKGLTWYMNTFGEFSELIGTPYMPYVDRIFDEVYNKLKTENKYFSVDNYPLRCGKNWYYLADEEFIPYLAYGAVKCRDNGVRFGAYMQTFTGGYKDCRLPTSIEELRFLAYTYLAFGVQSLGYYIYRSMKSNHDGIITFDGKPTKLYRLVKQLNEELMSFDEEYLTYAWRGALLIDGENNEKTNERFAEAREYLDYKNELIKSVKCSKDTIIGCFENESGEQAFITVNYGEPTKKEDNDVEITLDGMGELEILRNGKLERLQAENGVFRIKIFRGDGLFIKPIK